ncbi:MAG TPA: molybdopterin cofactor-binding domain-containing protein [Mesorhizobium sp.]|jgi:CO/xanthine dehydrogenase Mo-binding subunit/aerobic-type carbon monoxide dehydrogenase small subunit (CoxS/CutS family)|nr:molybdopterin cofactor-binding domain-containing protein [Mesorhizobium sp.]
MNVVPAFPAEIEVNGARLGVRAPPVARLSSVLRDELGLLGTKVGCDAGDCGSCTVLLDGEPVCACLVPLAQATGRKVETVEGLAQVRLSALQASFHHHGAAQCGICTPGFLMAASALLAKNPRPSETQAREALAGVLCRCTGYRKILRAVTEAWRLDGLAAGSAAQDFALLAHPSPIGLFLPRLDGVAKVTGTEKFGADVLMPGALFVRAIRSPHHHARFRFGDLDAFGRAHPGLERVFTARDIPGENRFGVIPAFADQPALAESVARFRGEAVALVAGERRAVEALDLETFPVTWEKLPALLDTDEAEAAPALHAERPGNLLVRGLVARGAPGTALAEAAFTVEGALETSFVEHAYIEPEAGCAWMEGDTLAIAACTQAPFMDRDETAKVLGLSPERVRIIPTATGGGFGSKLDLSVQPLIGLVALLTGRPAALAFSRAESMMATTKRHPARLRARIGADADGRLVGMAFEGKFDTGAYASWGPTVANRVPVHASGPYRTPHYRAEAAAIHTHGPVAGAFRGFGVPQAAALGETLMDRLADACGMDALEFRLLNALRDGDQTVTGQTLSVGVGVRACLDALRPHWTRARAGAEAFNQTAGVVRRGAGLAVGWYGCGNTSLPNPSTIKIGLTAEGRVVLHQGAVDIGQGSNTAIAQIASEALGLPLDRFGLVGADTALTPDAGKTSASRQTFVSGRAAEAATKKLREKILRWANVGQNAELALDGACLELREGDAFRRLDLAGMARDAEGYVFAAQATFDPPTSPLDENGQGVPYAMYGFGAQLVELEVDTALGTVNLLKVTAAHDVGRAVNPLLAEGQVEGGIAQGIGMALMEEYVPGRTENLHDYLIPTIGDVPEIETILVEVPDPIGPFGAKGLGEHTLIPTAPAILNAIRRATGAVLTRLPATPDRVLAALPTARA